MENIYKLIFEPLYDFDEISLEISELLGENIDIVPQKGMAREPIARRKCFRKCDKIWN
jgi:hypothetical protein